MDAELRARLRRQVAALRDQALRNDGGPSPEESEALERLARLAEIAERTEEPARRPRWPVPAVLALTLAVLSVLLFFRVSSTNVDIDLEVDEVEFVVPRAQTFNAALSLDELGAAGIAALRIPRNRDTSGRLFPAVETAWSQFRLSRAEPEGGRLTLDAVTPPAGTRMWLRKTRVPGQYALSLQHDVIVVTLTLSGWLTLRSPETGTVVRDFGRGKAMHLIARQNVVDIALTPEERERVSFARVIPVRALSLLKAHQDTAAQTPIEESTIRAGTVYFSDLDDKQRRLRPGEVLRLSVSEGYLHALQLAKEHVALSFHGSVTALTTGKGDGRRSLMPTYLEWLNAQHALWLLWGAAMYIFGIALAILRWWRIAV